MPKVVGLFFGLVLLFLIASVSVVPRAYAEERTPEGRIMELYKQDKVSKAREHLHARIKSTLQYVKSHNPSKRLDLEAMLGASGQSANLVAACLKLERQHGKGNAIPPKVWENAKMAEKAVEMALAQAEKASPSLKKGGKRYEQRIQYVIKQKASLLVEKIVSLRYSGEASRASQLLKKHRKLIESHATQNADQLRLAPQGTDNGPTRGRKKNENHEVVRGRSLKIFKLLLSFYEALSEEDAEALDKLVLGGQKLMSGKDIVEEIALEREAERDFKDIGPVRFDAKSSLIIRAKNEEKFEVKVKGVIKSFHNGEKTFTQRESDLFEIHVINGNYKLVFPAKKGAHR